MATRAQTDTIRVASWNVKFPKGGTPAQRWRVLAATQPDVVLLQEVRARDIEALLDIAGSDWVGFCSTSLPPPVGPNKRGVGVLVKRDFEPSQPRRLADNACFPGDLQEGPPFKALMVDVRLPNGACVTLVAAHARPAGRMFRNLKPSFVTALAK